MDPISSWFADTFAGSPLVGSLLLVLASIIVVLLASFAALKLLRMIGPSRSAARYEPQHDWIAETAADEDQAGLPRAPAADSDEDRFSRDLEEFLDDTRKEADAAPPAPAAEPVLPGRIAPSAPAPVPLPGAESRPAGGRILARRRSGLGGLFGRTGRGSNNVNAADKPLAPPPPPQKPMPARKKSASGEPTVVTLDTGIAEKLVAAAEGEALTSEQTPAETPASPKPAPVDIKSFGSPGVTKDGVTVAHEIDLGDTGEADDILRAHDIADAVTCSVFAPSVGIPGASLMVQVFLHVDADLIKVRELARETDPDVERRLGFARLKTKIVRGAFVDVVLEGRGLAVDEAMQSIVWEGAPEAASFIVTLPAGIERKDYFPVARLYIDGIPIGHIKFKLTAEPVRASLPYGMSLNDQNAARRARPQGVEERLYRRAFLSYSRQDFEPVSHFNEGLVNAGYKTFFDLETLASGERWGEEIEAAIREADVFFLCWTSTAKRSKWVDKECRFALEQAKTSGLERPSIVPIAFETPLPSPPEHLKHLHFNSRHQLIRAGMQAAAGSL